MGKALTKQEIDRLTQKPRPDKFLVDVAVTVITVLVFVIIIAGLSWVALWLLSSVATFFN